MDEVLRSIKEVREGGQHCANWYLNHGYVLLAIQEGARAGSFPTIQRAGHQYQYYVRRNPVYVLGRPDGVEPAEPPPRRESPQRESDEGT